MGITVTTKFSLTERAYILSLARDEGQMVGGIVDYVRVDVGQDGSASPRTWYRLTQTLAFVPPGGMWAESELGTEVEAKTLADAYNKALGEMYLRKST